MAMKIYLGADHRGFKLKEDIKTWLLRNNYEVEDCGALEQTPNDDYVDFAKAVSGKVSENPENRGILVCGSGAGMDVAANKIKGVSCAIGFNPVQVRKARNDDDINILSLSSDFTDTTTAEGLVQVFLQTDFESTENHNRRIGKIKSLENNG